MSYVKSKDPTPAEMKVLVLIAEGYTDAEIAERLHLSDKTIKTQATTLRRRMRVRTRAHAVAKAFREGILT